VQYGINGLAAALSKESASSQQLDHANIVRAVDFGVDDGRLFWLGVRRRPRHYRHLKDLGRLPVEEALKIFSLSPFAVGLCHSAMCHHRASSRPT